MNPSSLSVILPALNEENNLESAARDTLAALQKHFLRFEIIIIDDGSTDSTGAIAKKLASEDNRIRVIHHPVNQGLGSSVREGYEQASMDYVMWNASDHGMRKDSMEVILKEVGKADILIPYIANPEFRSWRRQLISQCYVGIMNAVFGLKARYYNGGAVYKAEWIRPVKSTTYGFFFFAETLIILLKSGCTFLEIPTYHQRRTQGKSKAFTFKNVREILSSLGRLFWGLQISKKRRVTLPLDSKTLQPA